MDMAAAGMAEKLTELPKRAAAGITPGMRRKAAGMEPSMAVAHMLVLKSILLPRRIRHMKKRAEDLSAAMKKKRENHFLSTRPGLFSKAFWMGRWVSSRIYSFNQDGRGVEKNIT